MITHVRTYSPRKADLNPSWRVIDAEGKTLGRLATEIATVLRGKDKPTFTRHMAVGDFVVVVNASKIRVSGQKQSQKIYYHHTQYPGGLREVPYRTMSERFPDRVIRLAVRGMLPHNRLGRQLLRRLKVYPGAEHPHEAQVRAGQGKRTQAAAAARVQAEAAAEAPAPAAARRRRRSSQAAEGPEVEETPQPRRRRARARGAEEAAQPEDAAQAAEMSAAPVEPPPSDESGSGPTDPDSSPSTPVSASAEQQDETTPEPEPEEKDRA